MKTETIVGLFVLSAIGVFFYLTLTIGTIRLDRNRFHSYRAYFDDTSGLEKKDPVKIAGVEVGQVEDIKLTKDGMAVVYFLVHRQNKLAKNSRAFIRQEGLLGNKYLEIDPGDSSTGILPAGSAIGFPAAAPASVGELLNKFSDIASSIKDVASALQVSVASKESQDNIRDALRGFAKASDRMANFSLVLERTLDKNEQNINATLADIKDITHDLKKDTVPRLTNDISDMAKKAGKAFESVEDMSVQGRYGFKEAGQVMEKVNAGKGLIGKLINEDETYADFKATIRNVKEVTDKAQSLEVYVDMHSETMLRDWNAKGYFEIRLRSTEDYFYVIQLVGDEKGRIDRECIEYKRFDINRDELPAPNLEDQYRFPSFLEKNVQIKNDVLFSFQFGKRFNRLALRLGVFENTFGMGADFYVPLNTAKAHWICTLEAFDWKGILRLDDTRPHFKWINRVYFMKNLYTSFGVDDFYSKRNANPFWGGGLRFNDNDLKYLLPQMGGMGGGRSGSGNGSPY